MTADSVPAVAAVTARIAALPAGRARWVGVDGLGGAGKTSFARLLVQAVPGAVLLGTDDFSGPGVAEWDWPRFAGEVVTPLRAGRAADLRSAPWNPVAPRRSLHVPAGSVIVLEGVSATRDEAGVPWDVRVWVDTPEPLRRARIVERDGRALFERWRTDWIPSEQRYLVAQRPECRADLVVDGAASPASLRHWTAS